ncbi:hypothetical protein [Prochlorothrix hollandica]|uniref:hypothetical protein n=1 Tax=Prochlorothrix hollandica TaxID=1223 RepID=UPI003342CAB8
MSPIHSRFSQVSQSPASARSTAPARSGLGSPDPRLLSGQRIPPAIVVLSSPAPVPQPTLPPVPSQVQRIQWQLALRDLALQQSRRFPTFSQWLDSALAGEPCPPSARGMQIVPHSDPSPGPEAATYGGWCQYVRTCLFVGLAVDDYSEWCDRLNATSGTGCSIH